MDVTNSIVPIFRHTEIPKEVKQIGTAVFVDFQSMPFLFTAAHVSDDLDYGKLLVPTVNGLSEIDGYLAYVDLPPGMARNDDTVDIAYYRLSTQFSKEMCFDFFPLVRKVELIPSALELSVVSVVGYSASKSKKRGNTFSSELTYYRGVAASQETYDHLGLNPIHNTVVRFSNKRAISPIDGKKKNPPSPRGASGGAMFAWPKGQETSQDWAIPKLVGIFHSYKRKEEVLIGTNLLAFAAAISLGQMKEFNGVV